MKAVKVKKLFSCIPNWSWNGQESAFEYKGELYLPLDVARGWYIIRREYVEEINYEMV